MAQGGYKVEARPQNGHAPNFSGIEHCHNFNDLEQPLSSISRSRHYLTLSILETAKDTTIVAIEDE